MGFQEVETKLQPMIEFKILTTPDKSQQATYQHVGKEIVFGRSEGDMIIDDPAFQPAQLRVRLDDEGHATLEALAPNPEARINGKTFSGPAPLKEKDNVTVGRTTLNFSRLDLEPLTPPEEFEHPLANVRMVAGSKEKAILDALEFLAEQTPDGVVGGQNAPESGAPSGPKPPLPGAVMPPPLPKRG
jgi:hypothetical protein